MKSLFVILFNGLLILSASALPTVADLRTEYRTEPLGIDSAAPRLSWTLQSNLRGDTQTAYRILVASTAALLAADTGDLWDSGQVNTSAHIQIGYAGAALTSSRKVYWKARVWDGTNTVSAWSAPATWTMGLLNAGDWLGQWIAPSTSGTDVKTSLLRRDFAVNGGLVRAVAHVTGLGQYEMSLNGGKVGQDFLSPGWTKYDKTVLYDTFEITSMLHTGTNAVGLMLGNGMYNVPAGSGRYTKFTGSFGSRRAIAQIRLEYGDGSVQTIGTDAQWKWSNGPVTFNTIYGGEDYNAQQAQSGWDVAGFNDSAWTAVTVTTGPGGTLRGASYSAPPLRKQAEVFTPSPALVGTAASKVYDFGQNAAQVPTLTVYGSAGATVKLYPAETGTTSATGVGTISQIVSPCYMTYTLKGSTAAAPETFTPRFFYTGYQFLRVDLTGTVTVASLTSSPVSTSSDATGDFSCSKTLFNQIRTLIRWAQRSNIVSILTDCPQREKLGWQEQYYLHGPSLRYEFNLAALYAKTYTDMADSQSATGMASDIAPEYPIFTGGFLDSPEWGSAFALSPDQQYEYYQDLGALSRNYANIKRYVSYLGTKASGYILNYGLGDWYDLGPGPLGDAQLTPVSLTATAIYYSDAKALAEMAQLLGNTADAATYTTLANNIRAAFNTTFYNATTGSYSTGSQTANAMPLAIGLVDDANRQKVLAALVGDIRGRGNSLTSGDIGHRYLLRALADNGRSDVIFDMHSKTDTPGYGYILAQGYTALTEGWDGSSSKNHFMLGHIMEWFYHDLAGIQSDSTGPGFKKIIVKPVIVGDVTWANATYASIQGQIASYWQISGLKLTLNVSIPPGSTATVYVPTFGTGPGNFIIKESGTTLWQNGTATGAGSGVAFDHSEGATARDGYVAWSVGSGSYQFAADVLPFPAALTGTAGNAQVSLSWTAASGAASYHIKRSTSSGGPYTTIASGVTATSYTDTSALNGIPYYYVVSAQFAGGESANSPDEVQATPVVSVTVPNFGFETPSIGTFQYNPSGATWTCSPHGTNAGAGISANASSFTSSNSVAPQGVQVAFVQGTGTLYQTLSGFTVGTAYTVAFSAAQRIGTNVAGQTWQVKLDGSTVASYAPGQSASSYTNYTAAFTASATSHTLAFAGTSGSDNTIFIDNVRITAPPPSTPTGVSATFGNGQVVLNWSAAGGAASYTVQRSTTSGGNYTNIATGVTGISYTDSTATNGITYYYRVVSANGGGSSVPSDEVSAMPRVWVARYEFEGNALDTSGAGYDGAAAAGVSYTTGKAGSQALLLSGGTNSYVVIPRSITADFSVALWVKTTDTAGTSSSQWYAGKGLVDAEVTGTSADWGTSVTNGKFAFGIGATDTTIKSTTSINNGAWHHVAATRDSATGTMKVYVDGVLEATGTGATTARTGPPSFRVGCIQSGVNFLIGSIDEVRIYNRALSSGEVATLASLPALPTGLAAIGGNAQIGLSWTVASGATSYQLKRSLTSGGAYTTIVAGVSGTTYADGGLGNGTTWYYLLSALNAAGETANPAWVSGTTYTPVMNWRMANFGTTQSTGNAADAADPDGDGWSNALEYAAGTNPNDSSSALKISQIQASGNNMMVSFPTVLGKYYRLERSDTLQSNSWTTVQDNVAGTGAAVQVTDSSGAMQPKRFYRLILLP